jgi:hypothetical protein
MFEFEFGVGLGAPAGSVERVDTSFQILVVSMTEVTTRDLLGKGGRSRRHAVEQIKNVGNGTHVFFNRLLLHALGGLRDVVANRRELRDGSSLGDPGQGNHAWPMMTLGGLGLGLLLALSSILIHLKHLIAQMIDSQSSAGPGASILHKAGQIKLEASLHGLATKLRGVDKQGLC